MVAKIIDKINQELLRFAADIDSHYGLSKISPLLSKSIKRFVLGKGKRVRPSLFILGYLGFAKKIAKNLYASAISLEILHDFMLVHDDIIDKSNLRRGGPSMHNRLSSYIKGYENIKFSGQDLAIVAGDIMYAMAIDVFLSIKEQTSRKEEALKEFIQAAIYTGSGEFIELLYGMKDIGEITQQNIYKIYDLKTAYYTFAYPLTTGAILAGAKRDEVKRLFKYGICLGRAFQIQDDILGMFSEENKIGKSSLTDLQETKKTILIWYAYNYSSPKNKSLIKKILSKKEVTRDDLLKMRDIIKTSGALDYARKEILCLSNKAEVLMAGSRINLKYKNTIVSYSRRILNL